MSLSTLASTGPDETLAPVAEINVTPLVDVMLVLLIIFMVTAPVMMNQLPITLPKPDVLQTDQRPQRLVVSFDLQNNYYIQRDDAPKEAVAYADLPGRLHGIALERPDQVVIVCADPAVIYDRVVDLMALAGNAGLAKVTICP